MLGRGPKLVALIRHGEATRAATDLARMLTATGREQAVAAGRWLEPLDLGRAVFSGSRRARETVELVLPGTDPVSELALSGLKVGPSETPLRGLEALSAPFADPAHRPPEGESLIELRDRVRAALATIVAAGDPAAVVAHRFVDTVLVGDVLGAPVRAAEALVQDPGSVNLILTDGPPRLAAANATPADPLQTGPRGGFLPDSDEPVDRRRYLLAAGGEADARREREVAAAMEAVRDRFEATLETLAPAEVQAACCDLAGLGDVAGSLPASAGSIAILDRCGDRWWVRCLGWDAGLPSRIAEAGTA